MDTVNELIGYALIVEGLHKYLKTIHSGKALERKLCEACNIVFSTISLAEDGFRYVYPEGEFFVYSEAWE